VAFYKGGKGKVDSLYLHDFSKSSRQVKTLLSNIMLHGLDSEHQRGIGGDDNDSSSSEEEEEKSKSSHKSNPKRRTSSSNSDSAHSPGRIPGVDHVQGWDNLHEYPDVEMGKIIIEEHELALQEKVMSQRGSPTTSFLPPVHEVETVNSNRVPGDFDHDDDEEEEELVKSSSNNNNSYNDDEQDGMLAKKVAGRAEPIYTSSPMLEIEPSQGAHTPVQEAEAQQEDTKSETSDDAWNSLTKVDEIEIHTLKSLVCAPKNLERSLVSED
jgi:hypothetical protein